MGEMVFAPGFAELDAEREVVLEEIAMYDGPATGARPRSDPGGDVRLASAWPARDRHRPR
jgi:hypothetical protein